MNTKMITMTLALMVIGLMTSYALAGPLAEPSENSAVVSTIEAKPLACGGGGCGKKAECEKPSEKKCGDDCEKACCQKKAEETKPKGGCGSKSGCGK